LVIPIHEPEPEPEPEPGQLWSRINLVFQSDFRYEIKRNFVTCSLTWKYWLENPGRSVCKRTTQLLDRFLLSDSTGWSGRWWRLKRSSTNWSFFSKWSWNWLEVIPVLKLWISARLCVKTPCVQLLDSQLDQLIETPKFGSGLCVRYRIEYRASYLDLYLLNKNLNKVRD
jgi:hypothetical protein